MFQRALAPAYLFVAMSGCVHAQAPSPARQPSVETGASAPEASAPAPDTKPRSDVQVGDATWYGRQFAGRRTANGERFDPNKMTAAHRSLPLGTWVEVTRVDTGQRVRVRITDRGPFGHEERIIDLSRAAGAKLGMLKRGVAHVEVRVVSGP
jgi:rare lipoprotein A